MSLFVFNTLTKKKEIFTPRKKGKIDIFVCGPTVYDEPHIGHAKTYTQFDIIVNYLRASGFEVTYAVNITDIDDKIIQRAQEQKKDPLVLAKEFQQAFEEAIAGLGIGSISILPRATEHIPEIISQVERLMEKEFAYTLDDGIYYDLSKNEEYGKLSGRKALGANDATSRIDENVGKKNKGDFCLWKFARPDEPSWDAPFGAGRPGWHIEDTAITEKLFGSQYDIHGGALDLIFPHHEAEIAQMESISGKKPLVKYWLHTGFLNIANKKMSKSLKNFITIKEATKKYNGKVLRYFFASAYYKSPMDFTENSVEQAAASLERLNNFVAHLDKEDDEELLKEMEKKFYTAMDDDFNTPQAFAALFEFMSEANKENIGGEKTKAFFLKIDKIFKILTLQEKIPKKVIALADDRLKARKAKDWKRSDELRKEIRKLGFIVEDAADSYKILEG